MRFLLERNFLPTQRLECHEAKIPAMPFSLDPNFIKRYLTIAKLASEHLKEILTFAHSILQTPLYKTILWHLHRWYIGNIDVEGNGQNILIFLRMTPAKYLFLLP
ncbi:MAG: hypothetical protein WCS73_04255 [Lentisphaeria bacterium]